MIESEEYRRLVEFYFEVKELIATAERADREQRVSESAIAELRNALDHIMRAHAASLKIVAADEITVNTGHTVTEYCEKNIDKAYGHLFRAGYDAYDIMSISLIEEINKRLDAISKKSLYTVIANAHDEIVIPYEKAKRLIVSAKAQKDVQSKKTEEENFTEYRDANLKLQDIATRLSMSMEAMLVVDEEDRAANKKAIWINIGIAILATLVGFIISWILG